MSELTKMTFIRPTKVKFLDFDYYRMGPPWVERTQEFKAGEFLIAEESAEVIPKNVDKKGLTNVYVQDDHLVRERGSEGKIAFMSAHFLFKNVVLETVE